ncbi:hypothetical protein M2138_001712 [Dysgonomonadaceae bacterium PH5-43]|nr:hypothetical protein [Dysgonomonadaceae bacterium PH5-43]
MEQLFNDIQNLIADNFPGMSLIDEDYGQLEAIETAEDTYPVTFPCVLISPAEVEWSNLGGGFQRGNCIVTVRLAIDCYDDTHYGSTTEDKAIERMKLSTAIHRKLQGFVSGVNSPLIRKKTINYSRPHAVKVYEHQYSLMVNDIVTLPGKA